MFAVAGASMTAGREDLSLGLKKLLGHPGTQKARRSGDEYATSAPEFSRNPMHGATIHPFVGWFVRLFLLATLVGCSFKAAGVDGESVSEAALEDTGAEDTGRPDDGDGPDLDPDLTDDDQDGYTEEQGDCDDTDDTVRPGLVDVCDGRDNDCDEAVDEDARAEDAFEPNDTIDHPLGSVDEVGSIEVRAFIDSEDDVDRYRFVYTDSLFDVDGLTVELSNLSDVVTYKLKIVDLGTGEAVFEDFSTPDDEALFFELEGGFGVDSTTFQVTVSSLGGGDCLTPYRLNIVHTDWWR